MSQAVKLAAIAILGAAPLAVLAFEVVLQTGALFTHVDHAFPGRLERALRRWVVTPSLHRVHHSVVPDETDSNFGFSVVWWDRLFGTYRDAPRRPEATMPIGLDEFRDATTKGSCHCCCSRWRRRTPRPARSCPVLDTWPLLQASDFPALRRARLATLQLNLGYLCNISCIHCHVDAGPTPHRADGPRDHGARAARRPSGAASTRST